MLLHPWGKTRIVVFPWGWILLHRDSGYDDGDDDDDNDSDDDDDDDSGGFNG